jgi:hypothetical protein
MDWAIFSAVNQPQRFAHGAFAGLALRMKVETVDLRAFRASITKGIESEVVVQNWPLCQRRIVQRTQIVKLILFGGKVWTLVFNVHRVVEGDAKIHVPKIHIQRNTETRESTRDS